MVMTPAQVVDRTCDLVARNRRRVGFAIAASVIPVLGLMSVTIDASAGLPAWSRVGVVILMLVASVGLGFLLLCTWRWLAPKKSQGQRIAESACGDLYRSLTTSLELQNMPGTLAARGAEQFSGSIDDSYLKSIIPKSRWQRFIFIALGACLIALITHVVRPTLFPMVIPRLLDPFGDHPPYSLTTLNWVEVPSSMRPPQAPRLVIQATGPQPDDVVVFGQDATGKQVLRVTMVALGGDQWSATMAPLEPSQLSTMKSPLTVWVEAAGTRTHYRKIILDPIPQLTGGSIRLTSPAYSLLKDDDRRLDGSAIEFQALPGSMLTLSATTNRPITDMQIVRDGTVVMTYSTTTINIPDPAPGKYSVVLTAVADAVVDKTTGTDEQNRSDEKSRYSSEAIPIATVVRRVDQPPRVEFEQPMSNAVATPGMKIPVIIHARDDLGLVRLSRYRTRNGVRETESRDTLGGTSDTYRGTVSTDGLVVGDELRIGAVATDTMPTNGQVSELVERIIHIMSDKDYNALVMEQIDQNALKQKYGDILDKIAQLEAEIAKQVADQRPNESAAERQSRLEKLMEKTAELREQIEDMRRPEPLFAVEPDLQDALLNHLKELEKSLQSGEAAKALAEQMKQDIADLTARAEREALLEQLADITKAQRETANQLQELRDNGVHNDIDRAKLREASRQEQLIEQALREWELAAKQVQEQLQDSHPQEAGQLGDIVQELQQKKVENLVSQSSRSARAGRNEEAHSNAEKAAQHLEALVGKHKNGRSGSSPGWCPNPGYGKCMSQLGGLAKRGYSSGQSVGGSGGGATGASGGGMMVRRGGRAQPNSPQLQLFGPETLTALAGARSGNQQAHQAGQGAGVALDANGRPATAYATDVRKTTAGVGASFSPAEEKLIEDYFRNLDNPQSNAPEQQNVESIP